MPSGRSLRAVLAQTGVTVVSRLRKDAALWSVPRQLAGRNAGVVGRASTAKARSAWPSEPASRVAGRQATFTLYGTERKTLQDVPGDLPAGRAV